MEIAAWTGFLAFSVAFFPLVGFGVCSFVCKQSQAFFHSSPPLWRRCVVWLYVWCAPPVCWYVMPPQVVMIPVSGALGQCPTHPWWPPCCAMLAWHYFVAVDTKHWPKLRSWWKHTSPAMLRTLLSWPPCELHFIKLSELWCFSRLGLIWFLFVTITVSNTSSMSSMAWHLFSSSMVYFCWLRVSMPQAPLSRPLENSEAPNVAAASALLWAGRIEGSKKEGHCYNVEC